MDSVYRKDAANLINLTNNKMFALIERKKWRKIRRLLKSPKGLELCQEKDSSKLTCLALALGHNAPIEVIQDMIAIDPTLAVTTDMFGASALHVACLNGSTIERISLLISHYGQLTAEKDFDERTPLHHAVEFACQSGDVGQPYTDVIELLCEKAPETVNIADKEGDTPIDLVQLVKIDITEKSREYQRLHHIYTILRRTSIKEYRKNKMKWELNGYIERLDLEESKGTCTTDTESLSISSLGAGASISTNSFERKKANKRTLSQREKEIEESKATNHFQLE